MTRNTWPRETLRSTTRPRRRRPRPPGSGPVRSPVGACGSSRLRALDQRCQVVADRAADRAAARPGNRECRSRRPGSGSAPAPGACSPAAAPARRTFAAPRRSTRRAGSASRRRGESLRRPARPRRSRASSSGTCSASTPNCLGPPPIFMPEPLSSKSGLTRTATRAGRPSSLGDRRRAARPRASTRR